MGRIKKDHSGYRTHGIFMKYQQPSIEDKSIKHKSKKDTNRWCRGKKGIEHKLYRKFYRTSFRNIRTNLIEVYCSECRKQLHKKSHAGIPLIIDVEDGNVESNYKYVDNIQVKVNGKPLPMEWQRRTLCWYDNSSNCDHSYIIY